MIRVSCDVCAGPIDRDGSEWYGVDFSPAPPVQVVESDDDGFATLTELRVFGGDHEHHFCSASCLLTWAFDRTANQP